ncbi:ATP-binding protein [Streptomyces sp. NPDC058867]|uniref:ATP-binding protein n=1 Tax=unclassified Streptomyces TaxID=2593676 RepID=UPI0036B88846
MRRAYGSAFGLQTTCLSRVRGDVREQLVQWGRTDIADDAALVTSELLTNARLHGMPPVRLALTLRGGAGDRDRRLRIEVTDDGPAFNTDLVRARWRHPSADLCGGGRGLLLVDALCTGWGDRPLDRGHTVWAELPCGTGR